MWIPRQRRTALYVAIALMDLLVIAAKNHFRRPLTSAHVAHAVWGAVVVLIADAVTLVIIEIARTARPPNAAGAATREARKDRVALGAALLAGAYVVATAVLSCFRPTGAAALPSAWREAFVSCGYLLQGVSLVPYELALIVLLYRAWRERAGTGRSNLAFIVAGMVILDRLVAVSGGRFH